MYLLVNIFILNWAAYLLTPAVYVWLDFAHSAAGSRYQYIVAISYICCVQHYIEADNGNEFILLDLRLN